MTELEFVQSWLRDIEEASGVNAADAEMMRLIEQRLKNGLTPLFRPGMSVRVAEDICGMVECVRYQRGFSFAQYQVSWWCDGARVYEWFVEPDVKAIDA
ncbi:hypothetical protein [Tropicimonas sp. S265A]|uniref:hypothetical protein n=1 Tax=Tropicimonas sp. S265A TaxID=3415134 RepID=UPI003C7D2CF9